MIDVFLHVNNNSEQKWPKQMFLREMFFFQKIANNFKKIKCHFILFKD